MWGLQGSFNTFCGRHGNDALNTAGCHAGEDTSRCRKLPVVVREGILDGIECEESNTGFECRSLVDA